MFRDAKSGSMFTVNTESLDENISNDDKLMKTLNNAKDFDPTHKLVNKLKSDAK